MSVFGAARRSSWSVRRSWLGKARFAVVAVAALLLAVPAYLLVPPSARAAAPGGAELAPGGVDQNAGAFTTSVGVAVPAFHGVEPRLALLYSSLGANGPYGVGWQLAGASTIERVSPGRGAPTYAASDVFLLDGEEMVASTGLGGTHVTKRQSYRRITLNSASNTWTVWNRDGVKSTYSQRLDVAVGKTVRWMLSSVSDLHGNTVNYGYWCDGALDCYLNTVSYNGTVVTLYRETRPDPILAAVGGALARTNYRIKSIDVVVSGSRARAYALSYNASPTTGRSLLASVTRYGRDASVDAAGTVIGGSSVPAVAFTYKVDNHTLARPAPSGKFCAEKLDTADFNGDGRTDIYCHPTTNAAVALSDGNGGFVAAAGMLGWCASTAQLGTGDFNRDGREDLFCRKTTTTSVALSDGSGAFAPVTATLSAWCGTRIDGADFNGDGSTDLYCHNATNSQTKVALSDGSGGFRVAAVFTWCGSSGSFDTGDFNGDGRTDFVCRNLSLSRTTVALSDGVGGFTVQAAFGGWCSTSLTVYPEQFGAGDFNGDGRTDLWCHDPMSGHSSVAISDGAGSFQKQPTYTGFCSDGSPPALADVNFVEAGDFNGDGRSDLVCRSPTSATSRTVISDGTGGFTPGTTVTAWCGTGRGYGAGDFNGDGKTDLMCHRNSTSETWVGLPGVVGAGDVVATVKNELGGVTTVSYAPAASWPDGVLGGGLVPTPARLSTVLQVQVGDGLGHAVTTSYAYSGGRWDPVERRFLGYERVTATDASGAYSVTAFRIEPGYPVNREVSTQRFSAGGVLVEKSSTSYKQTLVGGVYTSLVDVNGHGWCQGAVLCQNTSSQVAAYDGYGNALETRDSGDVGVSGDEKTTVTAYLYDTIAYTVSRVSTVTVRAGLGAAGAQLAFTRFGYNPAGDVTSTHRWLDTTNTNVSSTASYDSWGNQTSSTDEVGVVTSWVYDPTYHLFQIGQCQGALSCGTTVCPAAALCSAQTWDTVLGLPSTTTDVNGSVTSSGYDVFGRATLESRPDGSSTTTSYVNWGTPGAQYVQTAVSDGTADDLWSRTYSDGQGRTIKTVAEPDLTVLTTYNNQGLVASVSNPFKGAQTPQYTTYGYDAVGRQSSLTHPDTSTVTTTYSVEQNPADPDFATARLTTLTCDERGICVRQAFDGAGKAVLTSEWDGVGIGAGVPEYRTRTVVDVLGRITKVTDSLGIVSTMDWDSLGRKTSMNDPDAGAWKYGYDAAGHLTSQTDGNNKTVSSAYNDPLGRLTSTTAGATTLATFRYDEAGHGTGKGRMTSMTDSSGATSWSYDPLGRISGLAKTINGSTYSVAQIFDLAGRRKSLTYPDGQLVSYGYDASGCLTTIGSAAMSYVASASCTPTLNSQTLGNGVVLTQNFDPKRRWLTSDTATLGASVLHSESYLYRVDGRASSKTSADPADSWTYGYDNLGRLTSAANNAVPAYSSGFSYDQIGRIVTDGAVGVRSYPAVGAGHAHAPSAAGSTVYSYDGAGNVTGDGTTTYGYDEANRMSSSTVGGVTTAYSYDGQGTRVRAGNTSFVELDGKLLFQTDGAGGTDFVYYGTQQVARRDSTGAVHFYVADRLGSPHLILDAAGAVRRTTIYSPYGTPIAVSGTMSDPFGQAGDQHDPSGLNKRGIRYQDPHSTLFTSPDPSGAVNPAKPQSLNRYAYAANDPINNVDHSGKAPAPVSTGASHDTQSGSTNYTVEVDLGRMKFGTESTDNPGDTKVTISTVLAPKVEGSFAFIVNDEGVTGDSTVSVGYKLFEFHDLSLGQSIKLDNTIDEWGDPNYTMSHGSSLGINGHSYDIPDSAVMAAGGLAMDIVSGRLLIDLLLGGSTSPTAYSSPDGGSPFESPTSDDAPQVDENGFGVGRVTGGISSTYTGLIYDEDGNAHPWGADVPPALDDAEEGRWRGGALPGGIVDETFGGGWIDTGAMCVPVFDVGFVLMQ